MRKSHGNRWFVFGTLFGFMLLHQADMLLIGPLTTPIMETFHINEAQMGAVVTGALIVGGILYPVWGYLYDRYSRPKLLALVSFIWGSTTWLSALAPTFPIFVATRASTGIDDASDPGIYSLLADYFAPAVRGRIYGLLQISAPLGYIVGMVVATAFKDVIGWRGVFYVTGSLGLVLSAIIFLGVRDAARGSSEPELQNVVVLQEHHFEWRTAGRLLRKKSLVLLYLQGFFGVFPWNVITYWFFRYLEKERGYSSGEVLSTMIVAILVLAAGYPLAGALGDRLFRRTTRGRLIVSIVGVVAGTVLFFITMNVPVTAKTTFLVMLAASALFTPFASPNVISTVFDVTLPEVRSTSVAIENFVESVGAALSPLIAGLIAVRLDLRTAIVVICTSTWAVCALLFVGAIIVVPRDIEAVRAELRLRAQTEQVPS
jgi:MFS transporter, Spinster family, sphingosine-1-phosphate transporter